MEKLTSEPATEAMLSGEIEHLSSVCAVYGHAVNLLGRRWMGHILLVLLRGPRRFNEILAAVPGLSDPLLTQRLRELEAEKLVERRVLPASPVRVEYELTAAGRDLERVIGEISLWAHKWLKSEADSA